MTVHPEYSRTTNKNKRKLDVRRTNESEITHALTFLNIFPQSGDPPTLQGRFAFGRVRCCSHLYGRSWSLA